MRRVRRRSVAFPRSPHLDPSARLDLIERLRRDAEKIAGHFRLRFLEVVPERANVRRRYGVCFADGRIAVRLGHARNGRSLKYSSLVNTLCHELAHLRHFSHSPRFRAFYLEILDYARREGIYRPRGPASRRWVQMELFPELRNAAPAAPGDG